jgi:uncharacterized protein
MRGVMARRITAGPEQDSVSSDGVGTFVVLAWGTTWLLGLPLAASWVRGLPGDAYMFALAGLSAFGPTFAALVVAGRKRRLRAVIGRLRAPPLWAAAALLTPLFLHLVARLLERALGGNVTRWLWLPETSAQVAALFIFPIGEELGWRGFAHPILLRRYGRLRGPLMLGVIWGVWHLLYAVKPDGTFELAGFALTALECIFWSPVIAWLFERTNRSMLVAMAIHAGAHLDNSARIPADDGLLKAFTLVVLAVAALAAR